MRFLRLFSDQVYVRLDPRRTQTKGGLLIPDSEAQLIRTGVVLQTGPGRWKKKPRPNSDSYREVWVPMEAQVGERVAFFIGSVDTKTGQAVSHYLAEDERVIRAEDILLFIPDGLDVEVSR